MTRVDRADTLRIRLFGPIALEDGDRRLGPRDFGGLKPKAILEILLLARGRAVPKERLADLLWPDRLPRNVSGALETHVSVLRRRLGPDGRRGHDLVITEREAYCFAVERAELDLDRFDELVRAAAEARSNPARSVLEEAAALARGELLEDEPYADWAEEQRRRYHERLVDLLLQAADAADADGAHAAALAHAERALSFDALNEAAYAKAMRALDALGRSHEALLLFERCSTVRQQLGVEPSVATVALSAAIRQREDARTAATAHLPAPIRNGSPFIGRALELATLRRLLRESVDDSWALVLVQGEAGAGKSRLIEEALAGLRAVRIGRARAHAVERHLPYVCLAEAVREALAGAELSADDRIALGTILPELRLPNALRDLPEVVALESLADVVRRHAPVLLVLDDVHWADAATITALDYLARRCAGTPGGAIAAFRPDEVPDEHPLRALIPSAHLSLAPLAPAELEPFGIPELHAQTLGHPPLVLLALEGRTDGHLHRGLAELVAARCRGRGSTAYRSLSAAAVLEQPFDPEVVAAMLGEEPAELVEAFERACDRGLLDVAGLRFAFRFEAARAALAATLSPARRRLLLERATTEQQRPLAALRAVAEATSQ